MKAKTATKTLPGFNEYLPKDQLAFNKMRDLIVSVYESFGFLPIDTPVLERQEVLLAKAGGETEKQIYCLEKGDEKLALRFDLTVPFARYVSEHFANLVFPFRRYQIAKVYRGERPQRGRFREFYQADIDIVSEGELSLLADAEVIKVINEVFIKLEVGAFKIRLNNRKLLSGFLESLNLQDKSSEILILIDKLDKVGSDKTQAALEEITSREKANDIMQFIAIGDDVLNKLAALKINNETFKAGLVELTELLGYLKDFAISEENYQIDLTIARGLDYYTGMVCETILADFPQIGSVCSGGRYNNLTANYSDKKLPGVGVSIGLSRLFYQLKEAGLIKDSQENKADILLISENLTTAAKLADDLRVNGLSVIGVYGDDKFKKKLSFANRLGVKWVLILGEDEISGAYFSLKDMLSGEQFKLTALAEIIEKINKS